jgi:hypothetical protein
MGSRARHGATAYDSGASSLTMGKLKGRARRLQGPRQARRDRAAARDLTVRREKSGSPPKGTKPAIDFH